MKMSRILTVFTMLMACNAWAVDPGDLVINEIMQNPAAVSDNVGEWFEVYNATESAIEMQNMHFGENGTNTFKIESSVVIAAGGYGLFARNGDPLVNGGLPPVDYVWTNFFVGNSGDEIILYDTDSTTVIDEVWYDGGPEFPDPNGASMALLDEALDNNVGANWVEETAAHTYGDGDYGTPGQANNLDDLPPIISNVAHTPEIPDDTETVTVTADVTDYFNVFTVELIYTVDGGPENTVAMTNTVGDTYSGDIPAQADGSLVVYRIEATDDLPQTAVSADYNYMVGGLSIADVQGMVDSSPYEGQVVTLTGIVSGLGTSGTGSFFIQDAAAAWSGIQVYGTNAGLNIGDEVETTGEVEEYYGQTELLIDGSEDYTVLSTGNERYAPLLLTAVAAQDEQYESVLARVEDGTCTQLPDEHGYWIIEDASGPIYVDDLCYEYVPTLGECYHVTGIIYWTWDEYRLEPTGAADIELCAGGNQPPVISNVDRDPNLPTSADPVTVTADVTDESGIDHVDLLYTVDGGGQNTVGMAVVTGDTWGGDIPAQADGSVVQYWVEATDDSMATTTSDTFSYTVTDELTCADLADVMADDGDGYPLMFGQTVMVCGVLTAAHEFGTAGPGYLTHATGSTGVYGGAFADSTSLAIGDEVAIVGEVGFYNGLTQIVNSTSVTTTGSPGAPAATVMTLAAINADPEPLEASLLKVEGVTLVDPENWPASGSSASLLIAQAGDTLTLRIDSDTDIDGTAAPTGEFDVTGLLSQYDTSLPWTDGYQILPRFLTDIETEIVPIEATIAEIQTPVDTTDVSPLLGQTVITSGIVSGLAGAGDGSFFIQEAAAAWSGIQVYGANAELAVGDEVELTGVVDEYFGLTQIAISDSTAYTVLTSGNPPYAPLLLDIPTAFVEDYECVAVRVENVTCSNVDLGNGEWQIATETDTAVVDDLFIYGLGFTPTLGECYNIDGAMYYSWDEFKIEPFTLEDIELCAGLEAPVVSIVYDAGNVTLSWDPVAEATDYMVYTSGEAYGGWDAGTSTGGATTYVIPAVGTLFFHVTAVQ